MLAASLIPIHFPITSSGVSMTTKYLVMSNLLLVLVTMAIVGVIFTALFIKEPRGLPLEVSSGELAM
ncbi:hypothetical protein [Caldivirga sp. UBA161]|uniref:hypothetical protein n=1 Tax=Caldivirga sp. UBA161 TaxID=1915569 RepID=UPI0025BDFCE6|nr:hypothetical protein [Caldivirga sp. UBA161]